MTRESDDHKFHHLPPVGELGAVLDDLETFDDFMALTARRTIDALDVSYSAHRSAATYGDAYHSHAGIAQGSTRAAWAGQSNMA